MEKTNGDWRRLHNDGLHELYSSPSLILVIKSRGLKWAGLVERIGGRRYGYTVFVGTPEGKK
jgi:hypothetical protein